MRDSKHFTYISLFHPPSNPREIAFTIVHFFWVRKLCTENLAILSKVTLLVSVEAGIQILVVYSQLTCCSPLRHKRVSGAK